MFSTLRTRFGIPGVISVIALVFAMFGGAYAASNSASGTKATASAKAKKGPRGPKGAKGDTGPQGPAGPQGAKGDAGANGSPGAAGQGAETAPFAGEAHGCKEGGVEVKSASPVAFVCNGVKGTNGTTGFTSTLPSGKTETGVWSIHSSSLPEGATETWVPISFSIPLASDVAVHYMPYESAPTTECPGSAEEPVAAKGNLCIYDLPVFIEHHMELVVNPETGSGGMESGKTGALLYFTFEESFGNLRGPWAVTAP